MASNKRLYVELKPALHCLTLVVTTTSLATTTTHEDGGDDSRHTDGKIEKENVGTSLRNGGSDTNNHSKPTTKAKVEHKEDKEQQQRESLLNVHSDSIELNTGAEQISWDLSSLSHSIHAEAGNGSIQKTFTDTLSVRLPTIEKVRSIPAPRQTLDSQSNLVNLLSGNIELVCVQCGAVLLHTSHCRRVLPLPSAGWKDVADDWFCHQPSGDNSPLNSLSPKAGDLLVGRYTSLMRRSMLAETAVVDVRDGKTLTCYCCGTDIGNIVSSGHLNGYPDGAPAEIHHDKFGVAPSGTGHRTPLIPSEETVAGHLLEHCKAIMSYKFVLEFSASDGRTTPALLVWLLETDVQLLLTDEHRNVDCFNALKTLYLLVPDTNARLVSNWLRDNKVSTVKLPETICRHVQACLIRSSKVLPTSTANDMHVGFLRL